MADSSTSTEAPVAKELPADKAAAILKQVLPRPDVPRAAHTDLGGLGLGGRGRETRERTSQQARARARRGWFTPSSPGCSPLCVCERMHKSLVTNPFHARTQVEFYFSDANFGRDKFLIAETAKSPEQWIALSVIAGFNRMKARTPPLFGASRGHASTPGRLLADSSPSRASGSGANGRRGRHRWRARFVGSARGLGR